VEIVSAQSAHDSDASHAVTLSCPAGKRVVGGGAEVYGATANAALDESFPLDSTRWYARAYEVNATGDSWHVVAYAICAVAA
jgi:hypothetical protein